MAVAGSGRPSTQGSTKWGILKGPCYAFGGVDAAMAVLHHVGLQQLVQSLDAQGGR